MTAVLNLFRRRVVYKLTPELALYSSYSQSFTPSAQVDDDGNVASTEKGQTYELGAKWQTTPTMLTTFALYRIDEKDMSIFMNGLNRNIPKSRSEGAELEINGEFAPGWRIAANYSLNRTQIKEDNLKPQNVGNQLVNAPRNMGSLYLTHTLTVPGLRVNCASAAADAMSANVPVIRKTVFTCRRIPSQMLSPRGTGLSADMRPN